MKLIELLVSLYQNFIYRLNLLNILDYKNYILYKFCFSRCTQIKMLFLQWLPCLLRMSRPGKKITKKTILGGNRRAKGMELQEKSSKSLLANVLDIDDDIRHKNSAANPPSGYIRYISLNFLYLFNLSLEYLSSKKFVL